MPMLAISGRLDTKYRAFADAMVEDAPDGRHISIPGVGHNVVRDAPEELRSIVAPFISDVRR